MLAAGSQVTVIKVGRAREVMGKTLPASAGDQSSTILPKGRTDKGILPL